MQQNDRRSHVRKTSSKRRNESSIRSCKPCSVVLEYLTKREVEDLLSGNNILSDKKKRDREEKKRRSSRKALPPSRHEARVWKQRERKARKRSAKERNADCSNTAEIKPKNIVVHKQLKRVESQILLEDSSESDSESRASDCEQKLEGLRNFLREEKLYHDSLVERRDKEDKKITQNEVKDTKICFKLSLEKESSSIEDTSGVPDHLEHKTSTPKRFNLSLKKNKPNWSRDEISGQFSCKEISTENTDENSGSQTIQVVQLKQLLKRKIDGPTDAEASASKLKKLNKQKQEDEDRRPEHPGGQDQCNKIPEHGLSPEVGSKAKNIKNLRVSLVKLELMGKGATHTQNDEFKPLDRYIDVSEKDRDRRSQTEETKPQNPVENSPSKIRNTKITDYFFKVDKKTIFNDDDKRSPTKPDKDLALKEKFGICKDPVVALVDLKKAKTLASKCLASETKEPNSSIDLNSKSTTAISPLSSSVLHSNVLSPSFRKSTTDHTRPPSRLLHPLLDEDSPDKKLPAASQSLTSHKTPQTQKILPSTSTEDEGDSSVKHRTPRVRKDEAISSIRRRIQNQEASQKDFRKETNSSTPITEQQPSPTKTNEAGNSLSEKTTPKLLKIVSSHRVNVTLTPRKRLDLITVDPDTNESRSTATEMKQKSPRINEVEEKQDGSKVGDRNEPQEVPMAASEVDKNVDAGADERETLVRSPIIGRHSVARGKQTAQRRMPVNGMTFISREIIDDNSTWIDLDIPQDSANATNSKAYCSLLYCTETLPNDDIKMERKKTPKKISDASSPMLKLVSKNLSAALSSSENIEHGSSRLAGGEIIATQGSDSAPRTVTPALDNGSSGITSPDQDPKSLTVMEYLISKASEKVLPPRLAAVTVEPHSSGVDTLLQEKIGHPHGSDSATEVGTSVPSTEIPAPSETSLVEDADQDLESSKSQTELQTDEEERDLLIDTRESDSDTPSADTSVVSINSVIIATNAVDETVDQERLTKKECILCKKKYTRVACLRRHLKVHVKSANDRCQICHEPIGDEDMIEHLVTHSLNVGSDGLDKIVCHVCKRVFKTKSGLITHLKTKHKTGKSHVKKPAPESAEYNKCTVCLLACDSEEDLSSHMRSHNTRELNDAYEVAKAKQVDQQNPTVDGQNEASDSSDKEKTAEKDKIATESSEGNDTSKDCEISVCLCHKEERLELTRGVIIELALACIQCKTFFKTSRCFEDHYSSTPCTWSKNTVITPKLYCNQCSVILNSLGELHSHLAKHDEVDVEMKTSFLCKRCSMLYFSIGELFYAHWFKHLNDPMYVADHRGFPLRVNIVEPDSTNEPTQCAFIAEHQCQTCQMPFYIKAELKKHLTSSTSCSEKVAKNPKLSYKLVCSMCNKEYSDKSTFDNHIETHGDIRDFLHGPKGLGTSTDSSLSCSFCKTRFDTVTKYKDHLNRHRIMEEKFYCSCCYLMMDSLEDFEQHFVGHKGSPEKSITCKVVFAKAKFHCEPCILRFEDQSLLDEHLTAHSTATTLEPELADDSTPDGVSVITKKSPIGSPRKKTSNDTAKPGADVPARLGDTLGKSIVNTVVIDLSDDSDSTDIEIIEEIGNKQSEVVLGENNSNQGEQKTGDAQDTEKPVFLRVKNLKELLPFDCKACKAEFDTQLNLSKHVCTPNISPPEVSSPVVTPAQDKDFNYCCTICKKYQAHNDADWNLHILSHFPFKSTPAFNDSCYCVTTQQKGIHEYTCKFCHFKSLTIHTMKDHFAMFHPNIYRPRFICRVCSNFETDSEQGIRRHEFSHFSQPSLNSNNLPPLQPIENSNSRQLPSTPTTTGSVLLPQLLSVNNPRLPIQIPPVSNSGNNSPMYQVMRHFTSPQQSGQVPPVSSGDTGSLFQVLRNFTNTQQTLQAPPLNANSSSLQPIQNFTGPEGSSSTFQSVQNFINSQQVHNTPASSTANNSSTLQPTQNFNNPQPSIPPPPVTSSGNDSSSPFQTIQNFTNRQQQVQLPSLTGSGKSSSTLQPVHNFNNTQQGQIAPAASSANNSCALQPMQNFNKQHPPVQSPPVTTSSGNNPSPLQSIQNQHLVQQSTQRFNTTQQSRSVPSLMSLSNNVPPSQSVNNLNNFQQSVSISSNPCTADSLSSVQQMQNLNNAQPSNNWNKYQQPTTVPPVISEANNLPPYPPMDNSQWLTTTAGTVQIQINNTPPYNNMTHAVHTVPLYVANILYCCRICKTFKSSSAQDMKIHESMHNVGQTGESTQKYYRCKVCTNASFCTAEQLKVHMETHHNANEQSNGTNIRTQCSDDASELQCQNSTQVFDSATQLIRHTVYNTCHKYPSVQPNNQSKKVYPHTCQTCSIVFVNEAFLREHIRQRHPEVKLPRPKTSNGKNLYQCESCGLLLISEETLSYHMKSHSIGNGFQ